MRRFSQLLSLGLGMLVCACMADVDAPRNAPNVPTITYSDLTRVAVTLTGTYPTGADVTEYGFQWSQDGFETYKTEKNPQLTGEGTFTWTTTSLEVSTSYLFRSYITNGISTRYSTNCPVNTPSTSNATLSDVTIQNGYVTASIVDPGGRKVTEVGFLCGETNNKAELKRSKRQLAETTTGTTFTKALSSFDPPLEPGGTYYFLAYAEDETDAFGYSPAPQEYVVTAIRLDKSAIELSVGDSQTLTARFLPEGTPRQSLTWTSSNEEIATVTQEGEVIGVGSGTCIVKVMSGGMSDSCEVAVNAIHVEQITLDQSSAQMRPGATLMLRATIEPENATDKTVAWTSCDEEIATVSPDGVVTAVGLGSCTITAKSGEKTVSCEITIGVPVTSVSFDESEREVYVGENFTLLASIAPVDATDKTIVWKSSDETVATVSQDGAIIPKSPGIATISATATSGAQASFDCIVVSEAPAFPDEIFRKYVYENFDTNGDGFVSYIEAMDVKTISIENDDVKSLAGIEAFTNLITLRYYGTEYDETAGGSGLLTEIDISKNIVLESLEIIKCQIKGIDISNNLILKEICIDCCGVSEIEFKNNIELESIVIAHTNISNIDVSFCPNLQELHLPDNKLGSLDVSILKDLTYLNINTNSISFLDISNNPLLETLVISGNKIETIDLSQNINLIWLECQARRSELIWSRRSSTSYREPNSTKLSSLDIHHNIKLEYLNCSDNKLMDIDISANTCLSHLECDNNRLSFLDMSTNTELTEISCYRNSIDKIEVPNPSKLLYLGCGSNAMEYIDLSAFPNLVSFNCDNSPSIIFDITKNDNLGSLSCANCNLTELDVSNNQNLTLLNFPSNRISSIDVSLQTRLKWLNCSNNDLSSIDISNNQQLNYFSCNNNPNLTEIWMKKGQSIREIEYDSNITTIKYKE